MDQISSGAILEVTNLRTWFGSESGAIRSVDGIDFSLDRAETLAVVGESGSGKSVTCLSLLRLVEPPGRIVSGRAQFRSKDGPTIDLLSVPIGDMQRIRGNDIAMIFQEPMTSLNPLYTAGEQIAEVLRQHHGLSRRAARADAIAALDAVRIADPKRRADEYPFQMSGGMRQRVMIAMALICRPVLLLADEPTTALDVTVQAQILDLMRDARARGAEGMGILFVTHNMGVVAEIADRVMVMYAGIAVESGPVREVFRNPRHPYTRGLLASMIRAGQGGRRRTLPAIRGVVPDPLQRPPGCPFAPRCDFAEEACDAVVPVMEIAAPGHDTRCRRWREL